jgi:FdrA protein
MVTVCHIQPDYYRDSVFLMRAAQAIRKDPGVLDVAMMMGTPANKRSLRAGGLLPQAAESADPSDLIVVVSAETQTAADAAVAAAIAQLTAATAAADGPGTASESHWSSLEEAVQSDPEANVALISVPGAFAAAEARRALSRGLNVMLFSDNVTVAAEVRLKAIGRAEGRLVMGPDCGTAIIDGVPLGFANAVPPGRIGVIGASGTGMQAVTCLLARAGLGISQAIGTGSRDLSAEVGGASTLQALELLARDPATDVVVLVSKLPSAQVADRVVASLGACGKPGVVNFLGYLPKGSASESVTYVRLLEDVVPEVARLVGAEWPCGPLEFWWPGDEVATVLKCEREKLLPGQNLIRGLYCGGTLCQEAALLLAERNLAVQPAVTPDGAKSVVFPNADHCLIDLGGDEFTVGRPHPMIDTSLRAQLLLQCAGEPHVGVVLFDVVLGFGAHPDPAAELAEAVDAGRRRAARDGRELSFIASVCGTNADPQGLRRSEALLQTAGVVVLPTNAQAARLACLVAGGGAADADACSVVPSRSDSAAATTGSQPLFGSRCRVVNVGLRGFHDALRTVGAPVVQVDWRPPLGGDPALADQLAKIL